MCLGGGGGGGSSVPQQDQRDAPENESPAVTANRDSLKADTSKADTSGLPSRPTKEYLGWQKAPKYSGGWKNPDGSIGGSQSSKRY